MEHRAVVLLSGGIESLVTTALLEARGRLFTSSVIHGLFVDYGQNAVKRELSAAKRAARKYGVVLEEVSMVLPFLDDLALLDPDGVVVSDGAEFGGKSSQGHIVPFRNGMFLAVAAALADKVGASEVWAGFDHRPGVDASASDKSREFVESFNAAVLCGCSKAIEIKTPLQGNDKVDTLRTGIELHVDWRDSWSCYNAFAFPCGVCGSCVVRAAAFAEAGLPPEQTMSKEFIDAQLER